MVTPLVMQHQAKLRQENESLREQLAQLKAVNEGLANQWAAERGPRFTPVRAARRSRGRHKSPAVVAPFQQVTQFIRLTLELPREQIEAYLQQEPSQRREPARSLRGEP